MKSISYLKLFFLLALTCCIIGCGKAPKQEKAQDHQKESPNMVGLTEAQFRTAEIKLGKVELRQIGGTLKVNGILDVPPQQKVSVSFPLGGFLKKTDLLEGAKVRKGEVIAVIENPEFIQIQQEYQETKSRLEFASADYDRQQELARENVNAQKTLQRAKSEYESLQARLNALEAKRKLLNLNGGSGKISSTINIYAPIDGFVTKVNANIGKFVGPTDVLFEIVDTKHLHAELVVFEKDVPSLRIGQKVRFTLANETRERTASIHLIGREINKDRTVRVHCHLDQEDPDLLPGMYLKAYIETGASQVPALPNEAIVGYQGKDYIFVLASKSSGRKDQETWHFKGIEVRTGNNENGYTAVILPEDFNSDENQVVVKGAFSLLSKQMSAEEK